MTKEIPKEKSIIYFFYELRYRLIDNIINQNDWNFIIIRRRNIFDSLCSTFGICLFLSFLAFVFIIMINPLLYFRSIKLYFYWICYANLSPKWIAWLDLIKFFINFEKNSSWAYIILEIRHFYFNKINYLINYFFKLLFRH